MHIFVIIIICYDKKPVLKSIFIHDLCIDFMPKIRRKKMHAK